MNKHPSPENLQGATPDPHPTDRRPTKARTKAKPAAAKEPATKRTCIMVLGMHRSGTSALTRVLNLLGATLPDQVIAPDENNASGYWEPTSLNTLNEKLLAEAGSRWDDWRLFDPSNLAPPRALFYRTEISRIIDEEYKDASVIVLKEPRISRFVGFYADILRSANFELHCVLANRNPLEVIASLSERDGSTFVTGSLLWLRYTLESESATRGMSRAFASYDAMMIDWRAELTNIVTTLSLGWPMPFGEVEREIDAYLSSDHRHHAISDERLSADERILAWVKNAYSALRVLETDPDDAKAMATLDGVKSEFDAATLVFGEAVFPELKRQNDRFQVIEEDLNSSLRKMNQEIEDVKEQSLLHFGSEKDKWIKHRDRLKREVYRLKEQAASEKSLREDISRNINVVAKKELGEQRERAGAFAFALEENEKKYLSEVKEKHNYIEVLQQRISQLQQEIGGWRLDAERKSEVISAMQNSTSWRATASLRSIRRAQIEFASKVISAARRAPMEIWRSAPVDVHNKARLKAFLFRRLPRFFKGSAAYRQWVSDAYSVSQEIKSKEKVLISAQAGQKLARVICFYLPQFHEIPENDKWWGSGFTEWSNVTPARAQFKGHNQPRIPADLGYYNLLQEDIQKRQIEMASSAGIEGFCFYFYWFGGKRLLEKPIDNYLSDKTLDFPFCLCWANENWSRRWDGLDSEVLIGQDHSPDDDIAFIREIARFMRDGRYIRVGGKPLLLVYRPSLLPSARDTALRWRAWCRENGIGEIFLACTQSFEQANPADYGFDAAVEFPPNNSAPPDITDRVEGLVPKFGGRVYDWTVLLRRSRNYTKPDYVTFRGVCPAWDNTARRRNKGNIFVNNSPRLFEEWLKNAIDDTWTRFEDPDERLVFINAWNEWAEGAYLEPDNRDELAYLRAVRNSVFQGHRLEHLSDSVVNSLPALKLFPRIALVVHAYYPELLPEILNIASENPFPIKVFVTTVKEREEQVRECLEQYSIPFFLQVVENRGRDILPFFKVLPEVLREEIPYIAKVHTKRSLHRSDGDFWRQDMVRKVLSYEALARSLERFETDPSLGMIGPAGHFVSMTTYLGSNHSRLVWLAERLGLAEGRVLDEGFFAGTMFVVRTSSIAQLLPFVTDDLFDEEAGQVDGTFAHVLERGFALSVYSLGMKLEESYVDKDFDFRSEGPSQIRNYPYA
ncbi:MULTISPECIES: glycoside hydrolase family 99-like domain-containing protein [Mesorhizobium]|uniref:glycoside hydrolase family 99-like domain-containing protein n=1 Tax=Mesorhizobium australicum TaxID=536018 RepID=UPI003338E9F2